CMQGLVFPLTF
nr:immunoglobulin light chain junction region [Macaca mulatta]MOV34963.1 immunoglobulin light chain junction region [Macaca mulatta]MOV35125.1 immunoglobulin light chain junction region [Macaca mulatta]MOV35186.1 immunoglobulin light chain junction region [Macaca mulatta]